jgi:hypothetical protein
MVFQLTHLNPIAVGTCTTITGTFSINPYAFMAHGDGQKRGVRNFGVRSVPQAWSR